MEWAVDSGADVVNMSLGDSFASDGSDPMSPRSTRSPRARATLFVIAAGNAGAELISVTGRRRRPP